MDILDNYQEITYYLNNKGHMNNIAVLTKNNYKYKINFLGYKFFHSKPKTIIFNPSLFISEPLLIIKIFNKYHAVLTNTDWLLIPCVISIYYTSSLIPKLTSYKFIISSTCFCLRILSNYFVYKFQHSCTIRNTTDLKLFFSLYPIYNSIEILIFILYINSIIIFLLVFHKVTY